MALLAVLGAGTLPARAASTTRANCFTQGSVSLSPGIPRPTATASGNWTFTSTVMGCGGEVTGLGVASGEGTYSGNTLQGTFTGNLNASAGGFGPCSGSIKGTWLGSIVQGTATLPCDSTLQLQCTFAGTWEATGIGLDGNVTSAFEQTDWICL